MINLGLRAYYYVLGALAVFPAFVYGIVEIAIKNDKYDLLHYNDSTFSYKDGDKVVGFPDVKLVSYQVRNPLTGNPEYFLDEIGKKYLINKFINTEIIGPEIGMLNRIVFGDNNISTEETGEALGLYIPLTRDILLNTKALWKRSLPYTVGKMSHKEIQERRAEVLAQVLIHEYGHHIFSQYVGAPSGDDAKKVIPAIKSKDGDKVKRNRPEAEWDKKFYDDFYDIFYKGSVLYSMDPRARATYKKYNQEHNTNLKPAFDIYRSSEIFNIANGNEFLRHPEVESMPFGAFKIDNQYNIIAYPNNYEIIDYLFSMSEQLTRKLLPAIYKINGKYLKQTTDPAVSDVMGQELMSSDVYIPKVVQLGYNWVRGSFYTDTLFNAAGSTKVNNAVKYLRLINKMIGHDKKSELTISHSQSPWKLLNAGEASYPQGIQDLISYANSLKFGGYLDDNSEGFTHIGVINSDGSFNPLSEIRVNKFSIGYKGLNNSDHWIQDKELDQTDYYWYAKKYINVSSISGGKKLAFGKLDPATHKFTFRKVKSARIDLNSYGVMSNYDESMKFTIENLKNHNKEDNGYNIFKKNVKWIVPMSNSGITFTQREWW